MDNTVNVYFNLDPIQIDLSIYSSEDCKVVSVTADGNSAHQHLIYLPPISSTSTSKSLRSSMSLLELESLVQTMERDKLAYSL